METLSIPALLACDDSTLIQIAQRCQQIHTLRLECIFLQLETVASILQCGLRLRELMLLHVDDLTDALVSHFGRAHHRGLRKLIVSGSGRVNPTLLCQQLNQLPALETVVVELLAHQTRDDAVPDSQCKVLVLPAVRELLTECALPAPLHAPALTDLSHPFPVPASFCAAAQLPLLRRLEVTLPRDTHPGAVGCLLARLPLLQEAVLDRDDSDSKLLLLPAQRADELPVLLDKRTTCAHLCALKLAIADVALLRQLALPELSRLCLHWTSVTLSAVADGGVRAPKLEHLVVRHNYNTEPAPSCLDTDTLAHLFEQVPSLQLLCAESNRKSSLYARDGDSFVGVQCPMPRAS